MNKKNDSQIDGDKKLNLFLFKTKKVKAKEGWKQFLSNKISMLDSYERAKDKENGRKIKFEHGNVAESEFRSWLTSFLPKRYAVTSGYIISQAELEYENITHFDTIVYDQINCPVLWIDNNLDKSELGKSRAIPVEYIHAVFEVKSKMNKLSLSKAISKLDELKPFLHKIDSDNEKFKCNLPKNFFSSIVFFETSDAEHINNKLLNQLIYLERGFYGALVLSLNHRPSDLTGVSKLNITDEKPTGDSLAGGLAIELSTNHKKEIFYIENQSSGCVHHSDCIKKDNRYYTAELMWSSFNFSKFAFDFLAWMNGTYDPNYLSSFHGSGSKIQE